MDFREEKNEGQEIVILSFLCLKDQFLYLVYLLRWFR